MNFNCYMCTTLPGLCLGSSQLSSQHKTVWQVKRRSKSLHCPLQVGVGRVSCLCKTRVFFIMVGVLIDPDCLSLVGPKWRRVAICSC